MSNRRRPGRPGTYRLRESVAPGATLTVEPDADPFALSEATVSNRPWSDFDQGDYDISQWHNACLLHTHSGPPTAKGQCKLPVREPGGALNRNGVHAAASRIGQTDGTPEQKRTAARRLVRAYRQLDEDPPEAVRDLAGQSEAAPPASVTLTEASPAAVVATPDGPTGATQLLQLVDAGWGSSGFYSEAVLQAAARQRVFHEGLQLFIDHPTATEEQDRPERSVRDLAAVLTEDARYDPARKALVATAEVFPDQREALVAKHRHIGLSIRANGTAEYGEAEGRRGPIVSAITEAWSVDYVTRAGRGGKVLALLESAPLREASTIGARIEARLHTDWTVYADDLYAEGRLTRPERIALSSAVGQALAAYTAAVQQDAPGVYQRDLHDEPPQATEVKEAEPAPDTSAVEPAPEGIAESAPPADPPDPAPPEADVTDGAPPAAPNPPFEEEPEMSGTQTGPAPGTAGTATAADTPTANTLSAEARHEIAQAQLAEAQARITALEAARDTAAAERDTARGELRRIRNIESARGVCATALANHTDLPQATRTRIVEAVTREVPTTDGGEVDTARLTEAVTRQVETERAYIASIREAAGEGTPTGLGAATSAPDDGVFREAVAARMQGWGLTEGAAKAAAMGRVI